MKIAICLRGAVARINGAFFTPESLYNQVEYVNIKAVYNSIVKHIIKSNPDCTFDFFIHCWNQDLQSQLLNLYHPKKYWFENNADQKDLIQSKVINPDDYRGLSQAFSIQRSIFLCNATQEEYDYVILYRPDVLLWKDMKLSNYDPKVVTVNGHVGGHGDFHFVMNHDLARFFGKLFDHTDQNPHKPHFWIKNYVEKFIGVPIVMDDIIPGKHQEVLRKIYSISHNIHKIPIETFLSYGLTAEEVLKYNSLP